ncbi:DNRLRE domain-containing protein [Fontimonas sp. SYSU GA230001]|uniref:DNRLRE domain-containing protein n=1 Tax=Fontimonas sp. SYSU GA230001 TaxID=3142450 RepID=UPI0032B3BC9D
MSLEDLNMNRNTATHLGRQRMLILIMAVAGLCPLQACNSSGGAGSNTPTPSPPLGDRFERVDVQADADAVIYETGDVANGQGQQLLVSARPSDPTRRTVIHFSVDQALPEGALIAGSRLCFSVSQALEATISIELHRIVKAWNEGPTAASGNERSGVMASSGDVTWFHTGTGAWESWETPGGDFAVDADSVQQVTETAGRVCLENSGGDGNMNTTVQSWVNSPEENFGWILLSPDTGSYALRGFYSSNSVDPSMRPVLELTYSRG